MSRNIDIHELLKEELLKQGQTIRAPRVSGPSSTFQGQNNTKSLPSVGFSDYEIYVDSYYKEADSDLSQGEVIIPLSVINNNQDIKNCIEMKIVDFYFPAMAGYFNYNRIYMYVESITAQSTLTYSRAKFHFEFNVIPVDGLVVRLVPTRDYFSFRLPITSINIFDMHFVAPHDFRPISIPPDTIFIGFGPAVGGKSRCSIIPPDTTSATLGPVGPINILVFITNFTTNGTDPVSEAIINSTSGIYITAIIDNNTFEIGSSAYGTIGSSIIPMRIPKNRIAFPIRFTCVEDGASNYITISHN